MLLDEVFPSARMLLKTFSGGRLILLRTALMIRSLAWCGTTRLSSSTSTPAFAHARFSMDTIFRTATEKASLPFTCV